jgi:hypothetical protein
MVFSAIHGLLLAFGSLTSNANRERLVLPTLSDGHSLLGGKNSKVILMNYEITHVRSN